MSDKYNSRTMPLPKPKGRSKAMTKEQIALYSEWDPSLLQSQADERTSPVKQQQQTMSILKKKKGNASGSPKSYSPSTFEEWKAAASVAHPTGKNENTPALPTTAGNPSSHGAGRTVTGQGPAYTGPPTSRYGGQEMGVQRAAHAGPDNWRRRPSLSFSAAQKNSSSMVSPQRTGHSFIPAPSTMKPELVTESNVMGITSRVSDMDIDELLSAYKEPKDRESTPKRTRNVSASAPASPQSRKASPSKHAPPSLTSDNLDLSHQPPNLATKDVTGSKDAIDSKPVQREGSGFMAPNGTFIDDEELARLSSGVKNQNGDIYYFRPSFVTDPWVGLEPMKIPCLPRYW